LCVGVRHHDYLSTVSRSHLPRNSSHYQCHVNKDEVAPSILAPAPSPVYATGRTTTSAVARRTSHDGARCYCHFATTCNPAPRPLQHTTLQTCTSPMSSSNHSRGTCSLTHPPLSHPPSTKAQIQTGCQLHLRRAACIYPNIAPFRRVGPAIPAPIHSYLLANSWGSPRASTGSLCLLQL
jgi:hypothetical protein